MKDVQTRALFEGSRTPLLVTPAVPGVDLVAWLDAQRSTVDDWLVEHGGVLFRDFGIDSAAGFHAAAAAASKELMVYKERSSPRTLVREHVYTSTDYPADEPIFPHNEHSYANRFPTRIMFFCLVPPSSGGETPLVDCRRLLQRIPSELQRRFDDRGGWMYVRVFHEGIGLPWQTAYQTDDRETVERYCSENGIRCEWSADGRLKTVQVRPVVATHPVSGERIWFNHATFFNAGTLPPMLREVLLQQFGVHDLPNHTYYGDGEEIAPADLRTLQDAYLSEQATFPWQRGDVLLLDNMLTAHGRTAYAGDRRILVSMADPIERRFVS